MDIQEINLAALLAQEEKLQFTSFSNENALEVGLKLIEGARALGKPVSVNITRNGQLLFAHAMSGTSLHNAEWIRRKNNIVNRMAHSSFYVHNNIKNRGGDPDNIPGLDPREFGAHGGAFPLLLKGTGMIGTITVSGMPSAEDHALVVHVLTAYIAAQQFKLP